jgi:hypothetical protein
MVIIAIAAAVALTLGAIGIYGDAIADCRLQIADCRFQTF